MSAPTIIQARPGHAPRVASTIAAAFQHLAVAGWLVPDQKMRYPTLRADMLIWAEHALTHGMVDVADDFDAVAVWLPQPSNAEPDHYDRRLEKACGQYTPRFRQLDEAFAAHHPHQPHHHLAFLATRPDRQGDGLGTALLNHHHNAYPEVDCYLEASSPQSRDLYLKHGYHQLEPELKLPDDGPVMYPMWRDRTRAA